MYKTFLLTTALVAFSGAAFADGVKFSGSADMGIVDGDAYAEANVYTDFDLNVDVDATADNGMVFGATFDLDGEQTKVDDEKLSVFASGTFGKITAGDVKGAMSHTMANSTKTGNAGTIDDAEMMHAGANHDFADGISGEQVLRYDYARDAFTVSASTERDDTGVNEPSYAFAGSYGLTAAGMDMTVAAGYQKVDGGVRATGVTVKADLADGLVASAGYTKFDDASIDADHIAAGIGYQIGSITTHANIGRYSVDGMEDVTGYGMSASYDLGGSAAIKAGYSISDDGVNPKTDKMSFGVGFKF